VAEKSPSRTSTLPKEKKKKKEEGTEAEGNAGRKKKKPENTSRVSVLEKSSPREEKNNGTPWKLEKKDRNRLPDQPVAGGRPRHQNKRERTTRRAEASSVGERKKGLPLLPRARKKELERRKKGTEAEKKKKKRRTVVVRPLKGFL